MKLRKVNWLILVIFSVPLFAGCGGSNSEGTLSGEIKIDGSSTVFPVTEAVAEEFNTVAPRVRVTVGVSGTGGGFKKFGRGEIDISNASRPIKPGEAEACRQNNISYIELIVAFDGIAVVINPENDWADHFTTEELQKLWRPGSQGELTRWNQIRSEWPDAEIHLFGPGVASGTYDYFTEAIVGESGSSRGDFTASEDDNVLVQGVAGDKFGLGFFGLAYYEENREMLKLAPVDNGDGPVTPTLETVREGVYAPLSRPLLIYVTDKAAQRPEVREFIKFYFENAPQLTREVGYIPLPGEQYEEQLQNFKTFAGDTTQVTAIN